jgi:hypothetical protein
MNLKKYFCFSVQRLDKFSYRRTKMPAYNLRFGAMAAVARMKGRYEFEMPCAA